MLMAALARFYLLLCGVGLAERYEWTPAMLVEKSDLIGNGILGDVSRTESNQTVSCDGTLRLDELLKGTNAIVRVRWSFSIPPIEDSMDYTSLAGKRLLWFLQRSNDGLSWEPLIDGVQNASRTEEFKVLIPKTLATFAEPPLPTFKPETSGITLDPARLTMAEKRLLAITIPVLNFCCANERDMLKFLDDCVMQHGLEQEKHDDTRIRIVAGAGLTGVDVTPYLPPACRDIPVLYALKMIAEGYHLTYTVLGRTVIVDVPERATNAAPLTQSGWSGWKQGDVVELTGTIHPVRTESIYGIETDDGRSASLKCEQLDTLVVVGSKVWIKGSVEYVHYPKPKDYDSVAYAVRLPQTICYINVSECRILTPPPAEPSTPEAVFISLVSDVAALATNHAELVGFAHYAIGREWTLNISFCRNLNPVTTKRNIRPSDFGEDGILLQFVLDDGSNPMQATVDMVTYFPNLKRTLYADVVLWENASPEFKSTLEGIVAKHKAMLRELDKKTAKRVGKGE